MVQLVQCPTCGKTYMKGDGVTMSMPKVKRWTRLKIWFWNRIHDVAHKRRTEIHQELNSQWNPPSTTPCNKGGPSWANELFKRKEGE